MANLRVSELDFDDIKVNLKNFLSNYRDSNGDLVFTDYDFEGSGLSVLLDLLAYNTHYNAYLSNMLINEMFLDSAVKRESAVSIAKHLGYTPRSVKSARATINFTVNNVVGNPSTITLDRYTPFTTTINNSSFTFVNLESITVSKDAGAYNFTNVEITEGIPLEFVFRVNVPGPTEKYEIPNLNLDVSTMIVTVQKSNTDLTTTTYNLADDALGIDGNSTIYFLEENPTGSFSLVFGDGILGKKLTAGNLIKVQYLISNGSSCNVSNLITQRFSTSTTISGGSIGSIITVNNSNYGSEKETITEIKFNAPKFSSSQNRAVNSSDYKVLIDSFYPALIDSVAVWGGEENIPKKYGKVMIALSPATGFVITETVKNNIATFLKQKRILSISPEFVEPEYFYINLSTNVKYNSKTLSTTSDQLKISIQNTIESYFNSNLKQFDQDFVFSKLSKLIDETDPSILGNLITLKVQKRIEPTINVTKILTNNDAIKFYIGVLPGSLESTRFAVDMDGSTYPVVLKDYPIEALPNYSGTGIIKLINPVNNSIVDASYGTIDYATGIISVPSFKVAGLYEDSTDIRIMIKPQDSFLDVTVNRNQILLLDDSTSNSLTNTNPGLTINTYGINS